LSTSSTSAFHVLAASVGTCTLFSRVKPSRDESLISARAEGTRIRLSTNAPTISRRRIRIMPLYTARALPRTL